MCFREKLGLLIFIVSFTTYSHVTGDIAVISGFVGAVTGGILFLYGKEDKG